MGSSGSNSEAGAGTTGEAAEPPAAVGDPGRILPGQIARFGELAGRDLSARAFAAMRARGAHDQQRHGDAGDYQPLTSGEQLEMLALRAAITCDYHPAVPAGPAEPVQSGPERLVRPVPLRRPSLPGSRRAPARHRRAAPEPAQADPEHRDGTWLSHPDSGAVHLGRRGCADRW